MINRTPDEVAEYVARRLTPAEAHGWTVQESLPPEVRAQLFALLAGNQTTRD